MPIARLTKHAAVVLAAQPYVSELFSATHTTDLLFRLQSATSSWLARAVAQKVKSVRHPRFATTIPPPVAMAAPPRLSNAVLHTYHSAVTFNPRVLGVITLQASQLQRLQ